ncbi:MAG: aminotransferase class I/II-fold pyridoxal phosphate-dependent enzyme [Candidatus Roizmanbacteria bacterium]|nr:aminotransferase class I/II-fold pyridoxal phosphate-dependent enzyme [Candidatus Roizmanbacteria bacterium]
MKLHPFKLERYFAKYEFSAKYLLCSSDCDGLLMSDLIGMEDAETRKMWNMLALGYTESLGYPALREEIAHLYSGISVENILEVVPEEGIFLALHAILEKDDHVICMFPGYQSLYEVAHGLGATVTKWYPDESKEWQFDMEFLKKNCTNKTKLLIINFPHNPTGYLASKNEFEEIITFAKEHNLYILSDEMYRFLEYDAHNRLPSACEVYEKAVSLFGMSKTFGMAGVRTGWVITKDTELYKTMATFKDYTTICSSAPSEILSLIALRNRKTIISRHLKRIQRNLLLLDIFFEKYKDLFSWVRPKAGTIAFPVLKNGKSAAEFCDEVVRNTSILLLPSNIYDYDDKHFRIGFGRENMPEVLEKLDMYLQKI